MCVCVCVIVDVYNAFVNLGVLATARWLYKPGLMLKCSQGFVVVVVYDEFQLEMCIISWCRLVACCRHNSGACVNIHYRVVYRRSDREPICWAREFVKLNGIVTCLHQDVRSHIFHWPCDDCTPFSVHRYHSSNVIDCSQIRNLLSSVIFATCCSCLRGELRTRCIGLFSTCSDHHYRCVFRVFANSEWFLRLICKMAKTIGCY